MHALDFEFAARAPAAVDVRTWAPDVQLRAARTRAAVSVEHVDVDLWHRPVLDALAALMRALDAPVAHARRPAAARARVLDRLPPLRYAHVGLGALHVFVGGLDPDDGAPVERGLALQVGQTSLDFGRVERARPYDCHEVASRDARQALGLPPHIDTLARTVAFDEGRGAACTALLHAAAVFPVLDMAEARAHTHSVGEGAHEVAAPAQGAVSYTHLTLPTICSV